MSSQLVLSGRFQASSRFRGPGWLRLQARHGRAQASRPSTSSEAGDSGLDLGPVAVRKTRSIRRGISRKLNALVEEQGGQPASLAASHRRHGPARCGLRA